MIEKGVDIRIHPAKKRDELQNNVSNLSNNLFLKYWKPKYEIEQGIEKIINFLPKII